MDSQPGVMFAASIWSLIIPAIEMETNQGRIGWIPASVGIILGVAILIWIDSFIEEWMNKSQIAGQSKKSKMLNLAITLHNIPEGMAVRNCICIKFNRNLWCANYVCNGSINRNCYSEFSGRNGNFASV